MIADKGCVCNGVGGSLESAGVSSTVGIFISRWDSGCEVNLGLIVDKGSSSGSDSTTFVLDLVRDGLDGASWPFDGLALERDDFLGTSSLSLAFVFDLERNVFFWVSPSALLSSGSDLVADFDADRVGGFVCFVG